MPMVWSPVLTSEARATFSRSLGFSEMVWLGRRAERMALAS